MTVRTWHALNLADVSLAVSANADGSESLCVSTPAASAFGHQAKSSVGTGSVQMVTASTPATIGVSVKAAAGNTGKVYVGASAAVTAGSVDATDGYELSAGDSISVPVDNANKIWLIASAVSQKVFWMVA